ncbi:biotin-(acetyl-CoA carboxylase) ligase [Aliiruegeria haliotis]|uniref:Biotin-(Acetyl-CoA carboxylase) ligase n=1 Tax=Aliiruegeria haliotis TaxID=1280846 RepID=A0A2T0RPI3_9RHOB|nr:biotin/lipoate--protein ligase family protein [Aliiruegeria haliotis]PRY23088.1 biotin-(acetyl-CoA carboxylase) ligase [Aliiruegeria haliotis]
MSDAPAPVFPPLFHGLAVYGPADPFAKACTQAMLGCDAGLVVYNHGADVLRAAIVFAPEMPLSQAVSVVVACGVGFQNALGALAPPEVAVHLHWSGGILVNGASCGRLRVAASTDDPAAEPDWIVVGLELSLIPPDPEAPGASPDATGLYEEGCVEVDSVTLLEAWARHTLLWVNRMLDEGNRPLHAEWQGLVQDVGKDISLALQGETLAGTFVGTDEDFGMLLRNGEVTDLVPLTRILEQGGG